VFCRVSDLISAAKVFVHMGCLVGAGVLAALLADYFITPMLLNWTRLFGGEKPADVQTSGRAAGLFPGETDVP
jgi:hypothetical protein